MLVTLTPNTETGKTSRIKINACITEVNNITSAGLGQLIKDLGGYKLSGTTPAQIGLNSVNLGNLSVSSGDNSFSEGLGTIAQNVGSHAEGTYNVGAAIDTIHETGIGTSDVLRQNAFEIYTDGRVVAPSLTIPLINSPKSLVTQEYFNANKNPISVLSDLTDVTITTPVLNDIVQYNGTGWVNTQLPINHIAKCSNSLAQTFNNIAVPIQFANAISNIHTTIGLSSMAINTTGVYKIHYKISTFAGGVKARMNPMAFITRNGILEPFTTVYLYNRKRLNGKTTASNTITLNLIAGDILVFNVQNDTVRLATLMLNDSYFEIEKLEQSIIG